jgi:hypothetical protein
MNTYERWQQAYNNLQKIRKEMGYGNNWEYYYKVRLEAAIKDELHWRNKVDKLLAVRRGKTP